MLLDCRSTDPTRRARARGRDHHRRVLQLLSHHAERPPGHRQPDLLQCYRGQVRTEARTHPEVDLQVDSSLLQLARNCSCARPLPVRSQAGILGGRKSPQGAK